MGRWPRRSRGLRIGEQSGVEPAYRMTQDKARALLNLQRQKRAVPIAPSPQSHKFTETLAFSSRFRSSSLSRTSAGLLAAVGQASLSPSSAAAAASGSQGQKARDVCIVRAIRMSIGAFPGPRGGGGGAWGQGRRNVAWAVGGDDEAARHDASRSCSKLAVFDRRCQIRRLRDF